MAEMGSALEAVTGSGSRPPSAATDDEVTGIMGCWQALGAHAESGMLGAVREVIRRRAPRVKNGKAKTPVAVYPEDLPAEWGIGIAHEVAAALGISWQAADAILNFAFERIDEQMDLLRVLALVDSINGRGLDERVALCTRRKPPRLGKPSKLRNPPGTANPPGTGKPPPPRTRTPRTRTPTTLAAPAEEAANVQGIPETAETAVGPRQGTPDPGLPSLVHLTLPLADLLDRRAQRPGGAPGYGSLDAALVRQLAQAAIRSPRSRFCITLTDQHGHAAAHGCARLIPKIRTTRETRRPRDGPAPDGWELASDDNRPGPDGGYGAWILTLPGGRRYRVGIHKIPLHDCDHTYETDSYRPSALLRHLVQVRDGECTFTGCSRHARESDFEHAVPYDKGGRTDFCNAGARSRRCHQVKQSPGWTVTQPEPGWHKWTAPSGRSYTKGPKQYPS